ncbi:type-1 angiotensin II receptor-associated protein isoform X2 [Oncorhynchus nerka]|uniref:type-1 angiotensin II receptor-associated protein isoform X4 n=1 Tax=Oncorhynchus kisutch TaxID=8019 RepID=UPI0009A07B0B|nr:type-1 angiotensin II receptor-associated protein isoform X4 [Oncorhynchus kisutch]XP_021425137.1 type-1 angiotensin II receptor-associated protein isoform X2 [Oncorhynchus mykiss]XP_024234909.1 type-1 angiotensin II receptor-associated protein isoform X4 [Oncorhynchus tshawytscha]XP_029539326.1 type-1 angiotensin II receptor-associated protein-like isoform X2 [Oncorhynchus nerka]XP_035633504.1 type-1 angiotensin II receptor-associated protein isoform X2 [Oncorhynchus keta]XP_046168370.1 ty
MEIPAVNLKAIVLMHWLLTIWGCMAWLPPSYAWGNFSVLAVGVWAIAQRDSIDAVLMFLIGIAVTILTDIIHFGIYYPLAEGLAERNRDTFRFSAGMAILGLLLKPVSCFFVYQMYRERGGDYNVNFGECFPSVTRNRDAYQSIDQQDQSTSSANPFNQAEGTKPGPPHSY